MGKELSLSVLMALFLSSYPAAAADTVEDALCVCADGVLGTGDYVSCVSKMTRRLVAAGTIPQDERSELVSAASSTDLAALQLYCEGLPSGGDLEGFGTGFQVRDAFCPARSPSGPLCGIFGKLRMWNSTDDDIYLVSSQMGVPEGCLFEVRVLDRLDRVVRFEHVACADGITEYALPTGDVMEYDLVVPMMAENSDPAAGVIDSEPLPDGLYQIRIDWLLSGPQSVSGTADAGGEFPAVTVPVSVGGTL